MLNTFCGQRVFAAQVDVALSRASDPAAYGHAFDNGERIAFHQDAVFECARLGFIGIADYVVRAAGIWFQQISLQEKCFPFFCCRKCSAAAA